MPVVRITGPDDPRVEDYRDIGAHDRLVTKGLFVAEGRFVVERLIDDRARIRSLLLNKASYAALEPRLNDLRPGTMTYVCETDDFESLTGYNFHRGCLALAERPAPRLLDDLLMRVQSLVLLEDVGNADNVGSIFRNAAAFGIGAVVLNHGCADPLYRKAIRTSMAATLRVPFTTVPFADLWTDALRHIRVAGFQLVALTPNPEAIDLAALGGAPVGRIALLFGAEGPGLSAESEALAGIRVRIPTTSKVDSLNVAVAAGIAMHAFRQQQ